MSSLLSMKTGKCSSFPCFTELERVVIRWMLTLAVRPCSRQPCKSSLSFIMAARGLKEGDVSLTCLRVTLRTSPTYMMRPWCRTMPTVMESSHTSDATYLPTCMPRSLSTNRPLKQEDTAWLAPKRGRKAPVRLTKFCSWLLAKKCCSLQGQSSRRRSKPKVFRGPHMKQLQGSSLMAIAAEPAPTIRGSSIKRLTTENLPSPNHITQRVPSAARLRPLISQETILPGHQEKPRSFPNTSTPMPNPRSSCSTQERRRVQF
ncbi:hypothetical protein EYF80_046183 [Liparis tanakae]|uniref:Uncharacterized protein n=1 Tax=Liparis tanakae TaxID=230148 RepID=A0A4Z2FSD6_9TELE|nr:hypothetical protein EYF80_046183 [Liparis tanakae]